MSTSELSDFFSVLRSGDDQAVEQLLSQLDPILRRLIRLRLIDGRLRQVMDTTDIFQSLVKDFLSQKEAGPAPAGSSAGLCAYLAAAVRYKIQTRTRKELRHQSGLPDHWEPISSEPDPAQQVQDQDSRQAIRSRLAEPTRRLFDLKMQGLTWTAIAEQVGGDPDALRMRLRRAVTAVLGELKHEN
jgi:DNA-directed RNA polymerase specialized sigma24 family protein